MHANQDNVLSFAPDRNQVNLPPQNIEAEVAILGGIMLDPDAIARVNDILISEAFYISAHKDIYQAAAQLHATYQPTDLLSVTAWLSDHNLLNRIGGRNKLATLVDRTVSAVNIDACFSFTELGTIATICNGLRSQPHPHPAIAALDAYIQLLEF